MTTHPRETARTTPDGVTLVPLTRLAEHRVAAGHADVRGWAVYGSDGVRLGQVRELVVDVDALRTHHLIVALDTAPPRDAASSTAASDERLLPVEPLTVDASVERLVLPAPTDVAVALLPARATNGDARAGLAALDVARAALLQLTTSNATAPSDGRQLSPSQAPLAALGARDVMARAPVVRDGATQGTPAVAEGGGATGDGASTRRLVLSAEQLDIAARAVPAGTATFAKVVDEVPVTESVAVRRDEVAVERRPASADTPATPVITDTEIRIPLYAEQLVVEKRLVLTEEVIVRRTPVMQTETVTAALRRERLVTDGPVRAADAAQDGTPPALSARSTPDAGGGARP
ncbi:MAG: PRC and DUF2382 domain-containing protein [Gemmatimonadaceae bacterium]|nr:PRC and DUF2382 domain-containing protein [Gemmatimonadaceae bacterium]